MSLDEIFEIESPIHIGQVTSAYPATQKEPHRKVFLKVIHPQLIHDSELIERFDREGKSMAQIDHPNVVKLYEVSQSDGVPYMVLEWIDGGTLADRLKNGPLHQTNIRDFARQILAGLEAVHEKGFIHRDLKPDNILISRNNRVLLADFSLAGFETRSALTEHGAMIGSPAYMAPELLEGNPASQQSDLYGVGIILLEMLTGSNPYQSSDPMVSLNLIHRVKPPKLSEKSSIQPQLAALTDALLLKNPEHRPQSASDALDILDGKSSPVQSQAADNSQTPTTKPAAKKRFRGKFLLAGISGVVFIVALTTYLIVLLSPDQKISPRAGEIEAVIADPALLDTTVTSVQDSAARRLTAFDSTIMLGLGGAVTGNATPGPAENIDNQADSFAKGMQTQAMIVDGALNLIVRPWAHVFIDDQSFGVTPLGAIPLPPGVHRVKLLHDFYPTIEKTVSIVANEENLISVNMQTEAAEVIVSAHPWGYLWVNRDSIGMLPRTEPLWFAPGNNLILVRHPDLGEFTDSIMIEKSKHYKLQVDIEAGTMIANTIE